MTARVPRGAVRSVAVALGGERRENDWYTTHRADVLAKANERGLAKAFTADGPANGGFDAAMAAYQADPFRGARVRYLLAPGERLLDLELRAAERALAAADGPIDHLLVASWLPEDFVAPGDAVWIARALGLRIPAYNIESACSSGTAALQLAHGLVASGQARRVLVVLSSSNSRHTDPDGTLGWISSDAAGAMVIEAGTGDEGFIASYAENTADTCGVFEHRLALDADGAPCVRMGVGPAGGAPLRDASSPALVRRICLAALERAGLRTADVDFWGFSTPLAWFHALCLGALDVDPARSIDLFPKFANLGAPFPIVLLAQARAAGMLRPGGIALLFTMGSVSSTAATVLRLGDVRGEGA